MSISCVICGSKLDRAGVCPRCGYDLSQCRERYPTLADDGQRPPSISAILSRRFEQLSAAQKALTQLEAAQEEIAQLKAAQSGWSQSQAAPSSVAAHSVRQSEAAPSSVSAYSVRQSEAADLNTVEHGVREPEAAATPAVFPQARKSHAKAFVLAAVAVLVLVLGCVFLLPKLTESRTLLGSGACGKAVTWELYDDGTLLISGSGKITLSPWKTEGLQNHIVNVKISDDVTGIGDSVFYGCTSLISLEIPDGVTDIGGSAFSRCTSLSSVTLPDSLTAIGGSAFSCCTSLSSIIIPNNVTDIDDYAFAFCTSLSSVTIPSSMTFIGNYAFYDCTSLTNVYYTGTQAQWSRISIRAENSALTNAAIHCNYK